MDAQARAWRKRERGAEAESRRIFGANPSPMAILQAIVDSTPGPSFVRYVDQMAIEHAARRCCDQHAGQSSRWIGGNVVELRARA